MVYLSGMSEVIGVVGDAYFSANLLLLVLDILVVVGIEQQSFVSIQKCYQSAFFSDLRPRLKQICCLCCVE